MIEKTVIVAATAYDSERTREDCTKSGIDYLSNITYSINSLFYSSQTTNSGQN